jgi:hypothetical protein
MPQPLAEEILRCIDQAGQLYYRLVLLPGCKVRCQST